MTDILKNVVHFPPIKAYEARLAAANKIIADQTRTLAQAHAALDWIADYSLSAILIEGTDATAVLSQINNMARLTSLKVIEGRP